MGLMAKNKTILADNEQMIKLLRDWEDDKPNFASMKQKNMSLKMEAKACHNRERSLIWAILSFVVLIMAGYVGGGGRRM